MEISMSGLTPPLPPSYDGIFFPILLDIRPFFENTLKNFHFALWNARIGSLDFETVKFKTMVW